MTQQEKSGLASALDPQRNATKVVSVLALVLGIITLFVPMNDQVCLGLFFFTVLSLGLTISLAIEGSRHERAIKEGVVLDLTGQVLSPRFGPRCVGPVSMAVPRWIDQLFPEGKAVTLGLAPSVGRVVSINGQALPKAMLANVPSNLDAVVRGNVFVWPEVTNERFPAPVAVASPVTPTAAVATAEAPSRTMVAPAVQTAAKYCPYHGVRTELKSGKAWCSECSSFVDAPPKYCPYHGCRTEVEDGQTVCSRCNGPVEPLN